MERINRICHHPLWLENVNQICELEKDRIFCKHDTAHFLDVARIAYIENLENHLGIPKHLIYAAALLHDIGRAAQYTRGIPHEQAGAQLAKNILDGCGFQPDEQQQILSAITQHRNTGIKTSADLAGLIYRADKASRMCLFCSASHQCNWEQEKKNLFLKS